jgi:hypothetical protein
MRRSEIAHAGEVEEGSGAPWKSLLLEPGITTEQTGISELPLKEYLHSRRRLNYEGIYFPLGYPVRIVCNSRRVLEAADQSWGHFQAMFHGEPLEFQLEVRPRAHLNDALPPSPEHVFHGSLLLQIADTDNFHIADLKHGRAMGRVTPGAAACPLYLRSFFLEAAVLCMISARRAVAVHAACVRAGDKGVLLCGDSGEGKSTLAYAGARAGWTYVSDDATYIPMDREDRMAIGNCAQIRFRPSGLALFPELAGHPITPRAAGKPSMEIRTSTWPEIATANSARVDHIVFLNRRYADTQELVPLRTSSVLPWFNQHLISPPEVRKVQEATIARLLGAGVFELRYRDLGWAIDRIYELARKGN